MEKHNPFVKKKEATEVVALDPPQKMKPNYAGRTHDFIGNAKHVAKLRDRINAKDI